MSRINYRAMLNERLDELRRLYANDAKPGELTYIGHRRESGSHILYKVVNSSGGIRVIRRADKSSELLDYVEGMIDGTRAAILAAEQPSRDAFMN